MNATSSALEASYRRLLKCYPSGYRAAREEEMLGVLMDRARPDQVRASRSESIDLLACAARSWVAQILGPDPAARRRAADVLSVVLPLLLAYPASMIAQWAPIAVRLHAKREFLSFYWDWPAWLLWAAVIGMILVRWLPPVRWVAGAAIVVYLWLWTQQVVNHQGQAVVHTAGWGLIQIVTVGLLADRERLHRGARSTPRLVQVGVVSAMIALAYGRPHWQPHIIAALSVLAVVGAAMGLLAMWTATGRVIVPIFGACVAFMAATRLWAIRTPHGTASPEMIFTPGNLMILAALPVLALLSLRLLGKAVALGRSHTQER